MNIKCKKCKLFIYNEITYPFCIKCCYCNNKKHILQTHLDGSLPIFCHICDYRKWKIEFNNKNKKLIIFDKIL